MYFVATYSMKRYTGDPAVQEPLPATKDFLVVAANKKAAEVYARRFQNIATSWARGITDLKNVRKARSQDRVSLLPLSMYERIFPDR